MTPLFPPNTEATTLRSSFDESLELDGHARHFQIFEWEDRLLAHEAKSGFWWGTLVPLGSKPPRDFWHDCIRNGLVARAVSISRGFNQIRSAADTQLIFEARLFEVLIAPDNSGLGRINGQSQWHAFQAVQPKKRHRTLAHTPSIWSRGFHTNFVRRALAPVAVASLPTTARLLWEEGATARPIRLATTAIREGWFTGNRLAIGSRLPITLLMFWEATLKRVAQLHPTLPQQGETLHDKHESSGLFLLPPAFANSPEVAVPLQFSRRSFAHPVVFQWSGADGSLHLSFSPVYDSAHEKLEARLELRDWLGKFFEPREVEKWFLP